MPSEHLEYTPELAGVISEAEFNKMKIECDGQLVLIRVVIPGGDLTTLEDIAIDTSTSINQLIVTILSDWLYN